MAQFPALPLWTDAYLADCLHLSRTEHGTYLLLLIHMWRAPEGKIPNDDEWLAKRLRCSPEEIKNEVRPIISEFCETDGNWVWQKRLSDELRWVRRKARTNTVSAKTRWSSKKADANASFRQCERNAPTPTPTPTPRKIDSETQTSTQSSFSKSSSLHTGDDSSKNVVTGNWADSEIRKALDCLLGNSRDDMQDARLMMSWVRRGISPKLICESVPRILQTARLSKKFGPEFLPNTYKFFESEILREHENRNSLSSRSASESPAPEIPISQWEKSVAGYPVQPEPTEELRAKVDRTAMNFLGSACRDNASPLGNWQRWITPRHVQLAYERKLITLDWMSARRLDHLVQNAPQAKAVQ